MTDWWTYWKQYTVLGWGINIFSASNFHLHIFNTSATYLQSFEKIQLKLDFKKYYGEDRSYVRPREKRSSCEATTLSLGHSNFSLETDLGQLAANWFGTDTQGDYRAHSEI